MAQPTLQVAISGGGIAGLTAAIALLKHPGVSVQVYERARAFQEIGASIGIGPNGLRTLEKLGVENALQDGVCTRQQGDAHQVYRHWQTGEILDSDRHRTVTTKKHFTARFHRAHLHAALLENLPPGIVHLDKKTMRVDSLPESEGGGVVLTFQDGTQAQADLLIGADGIHSNVRKWFVPEHQLHWTGWVAMRSTFDSALVDGVDFPEDAAHWIGPDRSFFHSHLGKGQFTTVGGFTADPNNPPPEYKDTRWDDQGSIQHLRDIYSDWHPTVRALLAKTPYTRLYPNVAGDPLDTWVFGHGRVTLIGDAAHTHGGAFAAGGSLAMDDAYTLLLALRHVWPDEAAATRPTPAQLARVLRLYEQTRRPHVHRVMDLAKHQIIGKLPKESPETTGPETEEAVRGSREQVLAFIRSRPDTAWISEHDVEAAFREAVEAETASENGAVPEIPEIPEIPPETPPRGHL